MTRATNQLVIKEYDSVHPEDKIYHTHNKLLSHNAEISWSQSIRNLGKSYDAMKLARNTLNEGVNVAWLRWDRKESRIAEHELERFLGGGDRYEKGRIPDSNVGYITDKDTEARIYFVPVKDASGIKGIDIPEIRWCIYDECIPEFYDVQTRRDEEFDKFMSVYVSLKRDTEDFRVLMMSNCIDWFTGYTEAWGILPFGAGKIRTYTKRTAIETPDGPISTEYTIAFENVQPTRAMIERNLRDYAIRGKTFDLEGYFGNLTSTTYNLVDVAPDLTVPLANRQFMRDGRYFSYRVIEGVVYFTETRRRKDVITNVFRIADIDFKHTHVRNKGLGPWFEGLINLGRARFSSGHLYNQVIGGIFDLRKHV